MFPLKSLRALCAALPLFLLSAKAAVVDATYNSPADVPVAAASYTATGDTVNFTLNHAPATGANLTVVNNTGLPFIQGSFGNLAQGQAVALVYAGITYDFVANYYGGTGNDLVLHWANNKAFAWGYNNSGRLGDGTTTNRLVSTAVTPTGVLLGKTVIALAAGQDHSLALCSDGTVAAWGDNGTGELGNNSIVDSNVPVPVDQTGVLAGKTVVAISAGGSFSLALCSDGTVAAWGSGASGQLGNNITASSYVPVQVSTSGVLSGKTVVKISAGGSFCLAVCSDGTVASWGYGLQGQLGNNSTASSPVPVSVTNTGVLSGKTVISASAGNAHSLAVCSDGTVVAWGYNYNGQLGNNINFTQSQVPVSVTSTGVLSGKTVISASAGSNHSLAVCSDGTVAAWGANDVGQLGNNTSVGSLVPTAVYASAALSGKTVTSISAGDSSSLAFCSDGTVASWGSNSYGQLGNNSTTNSYAPIAVSTTPLASGERFATAASGPVAGFYHSLSLVALPPWPITATLAASALTGTSATLNGTVNAIGTSTTISFEYGLTTSYGTSAAGTPSPLTGSSATAVSANISGLTPGATYHYRVRATTASGLTTGADMTFVGTSANSNLSGLVLGTGTLAPAFASATTEYTVSVANTTTTITIKPTLAEPTASVRVNGILVTSGSFSGAISLAVGPNVISTVVTAQDGIATKTYTVTVTRLSANADLASLSISAGTLSPSFASATTGYATSVSNTTTSITLTPTLAESTASVSVNGIIVNSGSDSGPINLVVGSNVISTVVTAQNLTTKTYTVTVTRLSANADLSLLSTGAGTLSPSFSSAATEYTVSVSNATASITVKPTLAVTTASVRVNGIVVSSGSFSGAISLAVGANVISTVVTAQDGIATKTYTVTVTRLSASTNANLSGLALGTGTLSPAFASDTTDYTASVSNATTTITVRPTLADTTASVRINGVLVSSGSFSGAISLAVGANVISTVVTAQDGIATKTYTVTVTRLSGNADIVSLSTSAGVISPVFASATTSYTLTVSLGVTGLRLTPTVADSSASVKVNGTSVSSGSPSDIINLSVGSNTISTVVTSQSSTTKTYSLVVTRSQNLVTSYNSASDVAVTLSGLTATGNTANLSLNFAPLAGTNLTVVNNTGMNPISGTFSNLAQGQVVVLSFGGVAYNFVANYYGGNGNDLVLQWANTRPLAWGSNGSGQLGNNGVLDSAVPVPVLRAGVLAGKSILSQASGGNHSLALCSDGSLATWGNNSYGQLGNGSATDSLVPVSVSTTGVLSGKSVIAIAAGQYHNLALCSDGTLAAWGYNFYGQLGNNSTTESGVPVLVNRTGVLSGKTIISIAAGTYHSFALCSDGTLAAWGYNGNGELGNGGTGFSPLPVTVDNSGVLAGKTVASVTAGSFHSFALCTDGTLAGWGYNAYGQLGNNSANSSTVPTLADVSGVLAGKTIVSAAAGYYHTLALCSDGTLAAWGYNGEGELGNGNSTSSAVPVAVDLSGVLAGKTLAGLSAGAIHSVAFCADGTLATWGYNGDGELGNNSGSSSNVPVAVNTSALLAGEHFVAGKSGAASLHNLALVASPSLPVVTTLAATGITSTGAVLNGTVNPNGTATTPTFDYGLTVAYGTSVTGTPASVTGSGSTAVSASLSGLAPGTTYHYRLSGTSAGGTTYSADGIFTTAGYNANLSALTLSAGSLSPAFSSGTSSYTASVLNATTSTTVTPTVASPTSTVKVNGATVTSGTASMPIFLAPGVTTITVIVTAQDGVTAKTYTLAVTRLLPSPEIQVEDAGINIADGGGKDFGPSSVGRSASLTFTIKNTGNADLTGLGITVDGPDAAMFTLTAAPVAPVAGPAGTTSFTVQFLATSGGIKTAALHIASNDSDENPFDINLSGRGLTSTTDTDGDGLNDAAEFQMEALGFDWQVSQPGLVDALISNAPIAGLSGGQGLLVDTPILTKDPSTGLFKLTISVLKSTDLQDFTPLPMTAPQTTVTGTGKLEFEFASPDNAAFYRLKAE